MEFPFFLKSCRHAREVIKASSIPSGHSEPSFKSIAGLVKDQKEITSIYKEMSYEDLTGVLEDWLNPSQGEEDTETKTEAVAATAAVAKTVDTKTETATNAADAFDDLFNN